MTVTSLGYAVPSSAADSSHTEASGTRTQVCSDYAEWTDFVVDIGVLATGTPAIALVTLVC